MICWIHRGNYVTEHACVIHGQKIKLILIVDNKSFKKHMQQEIYIAQSAALNFAFFCLFVVTPNLSYGLLGTAGLLSNSTSWILGNSFTVLKTDWRLNHLTVSNCLAFWLGWWLFNQEAVGLAKWVGFTFFLKKMEDISPFLWGHWQPCFWVPGNLGFKARVDPSPACFVACVQ